MIKVLVYSIALQIVLWLPTADAGEQSNLGSESNPSAQRATSTKDKPQTKPSWQEMLRDQEDDELSAAFSVISERYIEEQLKGQKLSIKARLSTNRVRQGDNKPVVLLLDRQNHLGIEFNLHLELVGSDEDLSYRDPATLQRVQFASGETTKKIEFDILSRQLAGGPQVLRIRIHTPSFVDLSHHELSFLVEGRNFSIPQNAVSYTLKAEDTDSFVEIYSGAEAAAAPDSILPYYDEELFNKLGGVVFDSGQSSLTLPHRVWVNQDQAVDATSLLLAFQSGDDVEFRQLIYSEGDKLSGLNIYIDRGYLYLGAYNLHKLSEAPSWGPKHVQMPVRPDTPYVAFVEVDAVSGRLKAWLNGRLIGQAHDIGPLYRQRSGQTDLGAVLGGTVFHDITADKGYYFTGAIHKATAYERTLSTKERRGLSNQTMYDIGLFQHPLLHLKSLNEPKEGRDEYIKVELRLSFPLAKDLRVSPRFSGTAELGQDFHANASYIIPAFQSAVAISFPLVDDDVIENTEYLYLDIHDSSDFYMDQGYLKIAIEDNDGLNLQGDVLLWYSAESGRLQRFHDSDLDWSKVPGFSLPELKPSPFFGNSLHFNGQELMEINNYRSTHKVSTYPRQTVALALRTRTDVQTRQVVYKQGDKRQGFNIYIEDRKLLFNAFNRDFNGEKPPWGPATISHDIQPNSIYFIIATIDANSERLYLHVNKNSVTEALGIGPLTTGAANPSLGGASQKTVFADGQLGNSTYHFTGEIAELIILSRKLSPDELSATFEYWDRKY